MCTYVSAYTDVCYSFINVKGTTPMTLVPVLKSKNRKEYSPLSLNQFHHGFIKVKEIVYLNFLNMI